MIARFPGFSVLAGADPLLLPLRRMGGAGCITATSNLVADSLAVVHRGATDPAQAAAVEAAQARINAFRDLSNSYVQIPAIKAMVAFAPARRCGAAPARPWCRWTQASWPT
jgi:4-hydroxy-tetrahydrodipicolinate synthase